MLPVSVRCNPDVDKISTGIYLNVLNSGRCTGFYSVAPGTGHVLW